MPDYPELQRLRELEDIYDNVAGLSPEPRMSWFEFVEKVEELYKEEKR